VNIESGGQSPDDRATRYRAKAAEARLMLASAPDPDMRDTLQKLVADWEFLAQYALKGRR
jgi:hypothetical protein